MVISTAGIELIKEFEGCYLTAYKNKGETYWTIGYGHYGPDVYEGMKITKAQATSMLENDLNSEYVPHVNNIALPKFPDLNQNQFDALVSYDYNRGPGGLKQLVNNSSTIEELGNNIPVYWGSNSYYKKGLIRRRNKEKELFFRPVDGGSSPPRYDDATDVIENVISWALQIANDDSHGYDQANRWGPDYDCSSFVITAFEQAGVPLKTNGATYTGDLKSVALATDFREVSIGSRKRGDILLKEGSHVALYLGNERLVHASINEKGTITGGVTGDQTGKEICERSYYSHPWNFCLRYKGGSTGTYHPPDSGIEDVDPDTGCGDIWDDIVSTSYNIRQLSVKQINFIQTLSYKSTVHLKFTFARGKKEVGTNCFGKRLTFDTLPYTIVGVQNNGFLVLKPKRSNIHKIVNPKFIGR